MSEHCPVCGIEMETQSWYGDGWLESEWQSCPRLHYTYDYSYGYTIISVGEECFCYNYNTPYAELREITKVISDAIEGEKLVYQ